MALDDEGASVDWETHETQIRILFISQNKTWKEVAAEMSEKHCFTATERQYKYRFPGLKNVKKDEWAYIEEEIRSRDALGRPSLPCLHGQPLPPGRVSRGIARARVVRSGVTKQPSSQSRQRHLQNGRITVRTPPPLSVVSAPPSPTGPQVLEQAQCRVDTGLATASSFLPQCTTMVSDDPGECPDFGLDIASPMSSWRIPSPMQREPQEADFWSHFLTLSHPRSPSIGASPVPFLTGLFGIDVVDAGIRVDLHQSLTANLPWFQLLAVIEEQPDYHSWRREIPSPARIHDSQGAASSSNHVERRKVLSDLLGFPTQSVAEFAKQFQGFIPERREGDLSGKLVRILDTSSPATSALPALFTLTAFFASNNGLDKTKMDGFLRWIIKHQYLAFLQRFMDLQMPTVHAFAKYVFESAIRIKSVPVLDELLNRGVDFGSVAEDIASIGDHDFTRRVLMKMDSKYFKNFLAGRLFHRFVMAGLFDLAKFLLDNGVFVDARQPPGKTSLLIAVDCGEVEQVRFLVEAGADILAPSYIEQIGTCPLTRAVFKKKTDFVTLMLNHHPTLSLTGEIQGKPMVQWASIHCRRICELLLKHMAPASPGVLLGELLHSATLGAQALAVYVQKHSNGISQSQMEQALEESISGSHFAAAMTLLEYGVDPNGLTLAKRPIGTAIQLQKPGFVDLLLEYKADLTEPGLLDLVVRLQDGGVLKKFLRQQTDPREGMKALVAVAKSPCQKIHHADTLIRFGVNIDTPGLHLNPLQTAAQSAHIRMISFLLHRGANVNATAFPDGGRTALQAALESKLPLEVARIMLRYEADISAPPAMIRGCTAIEACCHSFTSDSGLEMFCSELLDAGAEVNRPNGEPSSVLHGVIARGWHKILARCLEPQYGTITNHMWRNEEFSEDDPEAFRPYTPTQLAASNQDIHALKMLLDYGTDVNELPGYQFGRTALQAACEQDIGPTKTKLISFLLDRGADVNAEAGLSCGVTALQAAAITGDVKIVELLISKGAEVNAMASFEEGRYAIEGAAEHGRLDTVKMLLNAGAKGNVNLGIGFEYAIELAEENGHFAVANLLKTEGPDHLAV